MLVVRKTFVLTGANKGKDASCGRIHFRKGVCQWQGRAEDEPLILHFIDRMWDGVEVHDGWVSDKEAEKRPTGDCKDAADGSAAEKAPDQAAGDPVTDTGPKRHGAKDKDRPSAKASMKKKEE